jgi:glycosyltransferase involved in cell wall biosynthesis
MTPALRTAAKLVCRGDVAELARRVRVRVFGHRRIPFPTELCRSDLKRTSRATSGAGKEGSPIKVLMFAHNLDLEGAPISQFELARGLQRMGLVKLEIVSFADGALRARYESHGIPVVVLASYLDRIATLRRLNRHIEELASFIAARSPDLVFANTLLSFLAVLAANACGVTAVLNPRESEAWESYFGFLPEKVAQRALSAVCMADKVIFVSAASAQVWAPLNVRGNFAVVPNALNTDGFGQIDKAEIRASFRAEHGCADDAVFLLVGTLCERKGQTDALEAFAKLPARLAAKARLHFVGPYEPSHKKKILRLIDQMDSTHRSRIRFFEPRNDLGPHYLSADVFVHCARIESAPRVILEALYFGLPIITTPAFGIVEQVEEGRSAMFYPPGDSTSLCARMRTLMEDPALRDRLKQGASERFGQLIGFDQMLARYEAEFRAALRPDE